MKAQRPTAKTLAMIGGLASAFAIGWMARSARTRPTDGPAVRPRYVASHEERVLAARVLVAANRRRGVATPAWIAELATQER
jgi:hypothetical protein